MPKGADKMPWKPKNPDAEKRKQTNARRYDLERGSSAERGYGGKWRAVRKRYLQANPLCVMCGKSAEVVDHITPHRGNAELMWSESNYQSLCKPCHDYKTGKHDSTPTY